MSKVSSLAINAADHLVSKGRLDAAASILRNFLSTNMPRPEILQRLGRILLAQGRGAEAVPYFEKALKQIRKSQRQAQETGSRPDTAIISPAPGKPDTVATHSLLDAEAS